MAGKNPNTKTAIILRGMDEKADAIKRMAEQGKTLSVIGKELGKLMGGGDISAQDVSRWLCRKDNAEWWKETKQARAHVLAEESVTILDKATNKNIGVKREQAKTRQWMAERLYPEDWGNRPNVAVQVNIQSAFVDAMREQSLEHEG